MPGASSAWTHASLLLLGAVLKSLTALTACLLLFKRRVDESVAPGSDAAGSACAGPVLLRSLDAAFREHLRPRQHRSSSAPSEAMLHSPIVTARVSARIDASVQGAELGRRGDGGGGAAAAVSGMDEEDDLGISFDSPGGAPGMSGGLTGVGPGFGMNKPTAAPVTSMGDEMDALIDGTADILKEKK